MVVRSVRGVIFHGNLIVWKLYLVSNIAFQIRIEELTVLLLQSSGMGNTM